MGKSGSVKGLVLASVFNNCYLRDRELTVFELLDADPMLSSHYDNRPQVLSNTLRRYYKQGLLYRTEDPVRGHPYRYNLTKKGILRVCWMCQNSWRYLYRGHDLLRPIAILILQSLEKTTDNVKHQRIKRILNI
jgi:DNA-binding HxlR family transcriptional regulator